MLKAFRLLGKSLGRARFSTAANDYTTCTVEEPNEIKVYLKRNGKKISPWHDIPVWTERKDTVTIVNEIP